MSNYEETQIHYIFEYPFWGTDTDAAQLERRMKGLDDAKDLAKLEALSEWVYRNGTSQEVKEVEGQLHDAKNVMFDHVQTWVAENC